jgi:hypothetical protein
MTRLALLENAILISVILLKGTAIFVREGNWFIFPLYVKVAIRCMAVKQYVSPIYVRLSGSCNCLLLLHGSETYGQTVSPLLRHDCSCLLLLHGSETIAI